MTAWMQLAGLSVYPPLAVRASATAAVHCMLAKTPWDLPLSAKWLAFISSRLPQSLPDTISDLLTWLWRCAVWWGSCHASWHILHRGPCTDFCADWSTGHLMSWPSRTYNQFFHLSHG